LDDIVPLSETTENPRAPLWGLNFFGEGGSVPTLMYMCTKFGGIQHPEYFKVIFGFDVDIEQLQGRGSNGIKGDKAA